MKKISIILVLISSFFILDMRHASGAETWKTLNGEHFIIHYLNNESFAKEVAYKAENYYRNIATGLGYPRYSEFWLWDKRAKIYIYNDHKSFLKATKQPSWSHGMAEYRTKSIFGYVGSIDFIESVLPHEIAHLIFRDFVGFTGAIPLWLDEGIAQWGEMARRDDLKKITKELYNQNKLLKVEDMMKLDMQRLKEMNRLFIRPAAAKKGSEGGTLFLTTEALVDVYYVESSSLVMFLIEKYGSYSFAAFCRSLRDGVSVENALKSSYPDYIRSLGEFEDRWIEYLENM